MFHIASEISRNKNTYQKFLFNIKKWDTSLILSCLKIPVLDACLIENKSNETDIINAITTFCTINCINTNEKVLLRAEKNNSICESKISGKQLDIKDVYLEAKNLVYDGYNVIIVKSPGDRLSYNKAFTILVDDMGNFVIEVLGKGFDATDLTKGRITPEITIKNRFDFKIGDIEFDNKISLTEVEITNLNNRKKSCEDKIKYILSSKEIDLPKISTISYKEDLITKGYDSLFEYSKINIYPSWIFKKLNYAYRYYKYLKKEEKKFKSFELIGIEDKNGKDVFFNVFFY